MPHLGSATGLKNSSAENNQQNVAQGQQAIANQIYKMTAGLRSGTIGDLNSILNGGTSPSLQAAYLPARDSIEGQFSNVENQLKGSLPRGGQLNSALTQADIGRAGSVGDLDASLRQNAFSQALGLGFQAPGLAISGLQAAGSQFANIGQMQQLQAEVGKNQLNQLAHGIGQSSSKKPGSGSGDATSGGGPA